MPDDEHHQQEYQPGHRHLLQHPQWKRGRSFSGGVVGDDPEQAGRQYQEELEQEGDSLTTPHRPSVFGLGCIIGAAASTARHGCTPNATLTRITVAGQSSARNGQESIKHTVGNFHRRRPVIPPSSLEATEITDRPMEDPK
ncbi:hypothetical protein GCM10022205_23640 [Spinactinospora alkalitolerans]